MWQLNFPHKSWQLWPARLCKARVWIPVNSLIFERNAVHPDLHEGTGPAPTHYGIPPPATPVSRERGGPQRNSGEGPQEESQSGGEEGGIHPSQSAEQEVGA